MMDCLPEAGSWLLLCWKQSLADAPFWKPALMDGGAVCWGLRWASSRQMRTRVWARSALRVGLAGPQLCELEFCPVRI